MTDTTTAIDPSATRRSRPSAAARARPDIPLPNGDTLKPRNRFASENLNVTDRTVQRMGLPTTYIAGVAHVPVNESLNILAARIRRPNQPRGRGPPR
jgi:hypothetical protein